MGINKNIENAIKKEIQSGLGEYFSYAWREKISEMLEEESKYARLCDWINEQIAESNKLIGVFCPADKNKEYTVSFFQTYLDEIQKLAVLVHLKEILLDEKTTTEMRENIEYTIEKLFNIGYSDGLKKYVYREIEK